MAQSRPTGGFAEARAARPSDPVLKPHLMSGRARISDEHRGFHRRCMVLAHHTATQNPESIKTADTDYAKHFPRCFT